MMYATNGAKSQCKAIYIVGYTKLTKSDKNNSLEMCTKFVGIFSFLCSVEYIVCIEILQYCRIPYWLSL
jgi:hypothetical protein